MGLCFGFMLNTTLIIERCVSPEQGLHTAKAFSAFCKYAIALQRPAMRVTAVSDVRQLPQIARF